MCAPANDPGVRAMLYPADRRDIRYWGQIGAAHEILSYSSRRGNYGEVMTITFCVKRTRLVGPNARSSSTSIIG